MKIVPMEARHCAAVAALHLEHLRTRFRGRAGIGLLSAYYAAVARSSGACGYVAENSGRVAGYICGVWDPHQVRQMLLSRYWPRAIYWGILQLLGRPGMAKDIARRLRDQKGEKPFPKSGYELRPIVVSTSERGSGLAAKLVNVLVDDARKRGFGEIYLITEQDNIAANAFYPKVDFHMAGEVKSLGQLYYIYERSLESSL